MKIERWIITIFMCKKCVRAERHSKDSVNLPPLKSTIITLVGTYKTHIQLRTYKIDVDTC